VSFLHQLSLLPHPPESIPVNNLVAIAGTPLGDRIAGEGGISGIEFVRTIAATRIVCPQSMVRLSAGRNEMSEELQALCFLAGANSIFVGNQLLTTPNPEPGSDAHLMQTLGLRPMAAG
ncbi:MAG: biotin synthase BioB, partial [Asticcacaulis sp.]